MPMKIANHEAMNKWFIDHRHGLGTSQVRFQSLKAEGNGADIGAVNVAWRCQNCNDIFYVEYSEQYEPNK